jgi:hypothetical protein
VVVAEGGSAQDARAVSSGLRLSDHTKPIDGYESTLAPAASGMVAISSRYRLIARQVILRLIDPTRQLSIRPNHRQNAR